MKAQFKFLSGARAGQIEAFRKGYIGLGRHPLSDGGRQEDVGHQVYPLIDTETSTEPVPVYKGSRPPVPNKEARKTRTIVLALVALAAALIWYFSRNQ